MRQPGGSRRVTFMIEYPELPCYNDKLELVVYPAPFQIMVGSTSDDICLQKHLN